MMIDYLGAWHHQCVSSETGGVKYTVLHNPIHFDRYEKLGTSTAKDYASIFTRLAKGELISPEADRQMLEILKKQHYNSMITRDFPPYYMDTDNTDEVLIQVGIQKRQDINACSAMTAGSYLHHMVLM